MSVDGRKHVKNACIINDHTRQVIKNVKYIHIDWKSLLSVLLLSSIIRFLGRNPAQLAKLTWNLSDCVNLNTTNYKMFADLVVTI